MAAHHCSVEIFGTTGGIRGADAQVGRYSQRPEGHYGSLSQDRTPPGKHPMTPTPHNPLQVKHLMARIGIESNITESLKMPALEAAGIEPASQYRSE